MATYTSKPVEVSLTPAELTARFADFSALQSRLDALTDEQRAKIGSIAFTADTIEINTTQVGTIVLRATGRTPSSLTMQADNSPVPMTISIRYHGTDGGAASEITTEMDVEIPAMIRPLIGPAMQKAVEQFGPLFAGLF